MPVYKFEYEAPDTETLERAHRRVSKTIHTDSLSANLD